MRELTVNEIAQLEERGCWAEDWSDILVDEAFDPSRMKDVQLYGHVEVGNLNGTVEVEEGFLRRCCVRNATLRNVTIGDDCLVENVRGYISNTQIADRCYVANVGVITNQEGTVTRESIKQELNTYANMLIRQRERIGALENQLTQANEQRSKLQTLLNHLNRQIAEKDATIQELQKKVEQKDFNLTMLQDEVTRLYAENEELSNKVQTQRKIINISQDKLHEAYYIIGTSKELKQTGVLSSKFLGKAKVDVDNIDVSNFKKVVSKYI